LLDFLRKSQRVSFLYISEEMSYCVELSMTQDIFKRFHYFDLLANHDLDEVVGVRMGVILFS
jgi:hypothetical protein